MTVLKAGDKAAAGDKEEKSGGGGGAKGGSFSSQKKVNEDEQKEQNPFRTAYEGGNLPIAEGDPDIFDPATKRRWVHCQPLCSN